MLRSCVRSCVRSFVRSCVIQKSEEPCTAVEFVSFISFPAHKEHRQLWKCRPYRESL